MRRLTATPGAAWSLPPASHPAATRQPPGCHAPARWLPPGRFWLPAWLPRASHPAAGAAPGGCRGGCRGSQGGCRGGCRGSQVAAGGCRRRPPRQPPWLPGRRGVAATDRGGCQACTRRRHARLREPRLERLEDDYDVALEGDHHRQDVARSKADTQSEHAGAPGMRVSCRTTPRPSHRSAPSAQADF